jgi:hypothetical protein
MSSGRPQHVARPGLAGRQHVAVRVHHGLGRAGGAAGEGEQGDVVGGSRAGRERGCLMRHQLTKIARIVRRVEAQHMLQRRECLLCLLQFLKQASVANGGHRLRLVDHLAQLGGAQQRHGGHRDQPGLDHRQPRQRHANRVAAAQQHAVAGLQLQLVGKVVGDAIDPLARFGVGEGDLRRAQQGPVGPTARRGAIEQALDQVGLVGDAQLRQVVTQLGPLIARRQTVVDEAVGLGAGRCHESTAFPMMSCCTSVAPS